MGSFFKILGFLIFLCIGISIGSIIITSTSVEASKYPFKTRLYRYIKGVFFILLSGFIFWLLLKLASKYE